ncbi:MAG: sugar transferase [Geodermatophilaceae bacterium]
MTALLGASVAQPRTIRIARPAITTAQWQRRYVLRAALLDIAVGLVGALLGLLRFESGRTGIPYLVLTVLLPVAWLLSLAVSRAYEPRFLFVGNDEYRRVTNAALWLTALLVGSSYAVNFELARGYVLITLPVTALGTLAGRHLLRHRLYLARARGECMRPVLVMGYERAVAGLCGQLQRLPHHGMKVVGALLPADRIRAGALSDVGVPVVGSFDDAAEAVARTGADTVAVLACPELDAQALRRLAWKLEKSDTDLIVAPALMDAAGPRTTIRPIDGLPMLHVEHPELTGARRVVKTLIDRFMAALILVLLAPVMVIIAVLIRRDSPGPALFRQVRVGQDGQPFTVYKFRTMQDSAEARLAALLEKDEGNGVLFKMRLDPRITRVGRTLRRYSLDELPQLFNVLSGRMSMVGPRPPLPSEVELYVPDTLRRLAVKPGMTGLWQVSGRSDLSWEESVRLDLRYVENWSLTSDLVILMRTLGAVLRPSGAY